MEPGAALVALLGAWESHVSLFFHPSPGSSGGSPRHTKMSSSSSSSKESKKSCAKPPHASGSPVSKWLGIHIGAPGPTLTQQLMLMIAELAPSSSSSAMRLLQRSRRRSCCSVVMVMAVSRFEAQAACQSVTLLHRSHYATVPLLRQVVAGGSLDSSCFVGFLSNIKTNRWPGCSLSIARRFLRLSCSTIAMHSP